MIFLQEFWEQLEHLQASCLPEASPVWGEHTYNISSEKSSTQMLLMSNSCSPSEQILSGYSERGSSGCRDECSREVCFEVSTHSRTQGLWCPWRLSRTCQRSGESFCLDIFTTLQQILIASTLCEIGYFILIPVPLQVFEMKWHNVAGWTGQGGSLLGTKRWATGHFDFYKINIFEYS